MLFIQEKAVHEGMFATKETKNVQKSNAVEEAIVEEDAELNPDGSAPQHKKIINKVKKKTTRILQEMVAMISCP